MQGKTSAHIRSNVVGYLALFLALTGTASGLPGINRVNSGDIKNNTIRGKDVRRNSLTGADINEATLDQPGGVKPGAAGGDLTGYYPDPLIAPNAVGSGDVANNSLTGSDINESSLDASLWLTKGRSHGKFCGGVPPEATATCAQVSLSLPHQARVLVVARAEGYNGNFGCNVTVNNSTDALPHAASFSVEYPDARTGYTQNGSTTVVTDSLNGGVYVFRLQCDAPAGAVVYQAELSALRIGDS